jgi:hypothetical protein
MILDTAERKPHERMKAALSGEMAAVNALIRERMARATRRASPR